MIDATKTPRQSMLKVRFFLLVVGLFTAPAWAINKCTDAHGRVIYQEASCEAAQLVPLGSQARQDQSATAPKQKLVMTPEEIAKQLEDGIPSAVRTEAERKKFDAMRMEIMQRKEVAPPTVRVGMTADQTREVWGSPSRVNRTESAYGVREQWVYGASRYVYLRNGVVESVQTSRK